MSDLQNYISERKKRDKEFAEGFEEGYEKFKVGVILRQAREEAGLSREELAKRINTSKSIISRIEHHVEDVKLSILEQVAKSLGKRLRVSMVE